MTLCLCRCMWGFSDCYVTARNFKLETRSWAKKISRCPEMLKACRYPSLLAYLPLVLIFIFTIINVFTIFIITYSQTAIFCPQLRALVTTRTAVEEDARPYRDGPACPQWVFTALTVWHLSAAVFTVRRVCLSFHGEDDTGAEWKAWDKQHLGCRKNKKQLIKGNSKRALWVWKKKVKTSIIKTKPTEALSQQSLVSCIQYLVFSI